MDGLKNMSADDLKQGIMTLEEADKTILKHIKDVPRVIPAAAYTCAVLNVLLPGTGSMIAGCLGDRD